MLSLPKEASIFTASQAGAALLLAAALLATGTATPPTVTDPARVLQLVRASALAYSSKLPDFICTQTTRRNVWDTSGSGNLGTGMSGRGQLGFAPNPDASASGREIVERVTYFDQKENYQVVAIDGRKATGVSPLQFQGAITAGEFGSALYGIFDPASQTIFTPAKIANLHGRRAWVLDFRVSKEHGSIVLLHNPEREIVVPYSGQVFVDPASLDVLRIHSVLDLPSGLPLLYAQTTVEYKPTAIAGRQYNLPFRSEVRLQDGSHSYINTIEFRHYHEFLAKSKILGESGAH